MKKILSFIFFIGIISCTEDNKIEHLNGYWEIESVKKEGELIRKYTFSNTIDYFYINNLEGYRKKVTSQSNGRFMITLHQSDLNISIEKGEYILRYPKRNKTYFDTNIKHHHHFFDEDEKKLIDIEDNEVGPIQIKKTIPGKKIKSIEILAKIDSNN